VTLATRYGVAPAEIMAWFCAGNGFGEIDLAYSLSAQTGVSVNAIFALRAAGLGWGQIMEQLGVQPGGGPSDRTPGPPPDHTPGRP
jgi:hypothetical protein